MGAMNTFYMIGFWPGMLVLLLDIGKGALAVFCSYLFAVLFNVPGNIYVPIEMVSGIMVIAGHNFPVFLKFKGGKGGATAIGVLAFIVPWAIPVYLLSFLLLLVITRWATFSYGITSVIVYPLMAWFSNSDLQLNLLGWVIKFTESEYRLALTIYAAFIALVPILMYIPRIKEIWSKAGGNLIRGIFRKNLKDRL
jgi:glycerol-3-phosphate acyltransferase PlsY